jgi:CHAD domain-containing protein
LLEQADHALRGLQAGASVKAIHEARKAAKRARAAIALCRDGLGPVATNQVGGSFRDAARAIGPVRDSDVLRAKLVAMGLPPDPVPEPEREEPTRLAIAGFEHARMLVEALDLGGVTQPALLRGLTRSYRKVRKTMDDAEESRDAEALHEWRKATKAFLYHLQLVQPLEPALLTPPARLVDILQEIQGEHHDLAVLMGLVQPDPAMRVRMATRSSRLEERALALGGWLFGADAAAFGRWIEGLGGSDP